MVDALGLAETTPGPLILVTQFVGFLASFALPAPLAGDAGILGAAMATWAVFAPSFLLDFRRRAVHRRPAPQPQGFAGALAAITAAVVGVILNLSLWFALNVVFGDVTQLTVGLFRWFVPDVATWILARWRSRSLRCWCSGGISI